MAKQQDLNRAVEHKFLAKDAEGRYLVDDEAMRIAFGAFAIDLAASLGADALPHSVLVQADHLFQKAQLTGLETPQRMREMVDAVIDATPGARNAFEELHVIAREASLNGNAEALGHAFATMIGTTGRRSALDSGVRPEGTTRAGPATRFTLPSGEPKRPR